jgi:hypothetical protein
VAARKGLILLANSEAPIRAKLDEWLTPAPACPTEAEFEQQLVAQGILSTVPPPLTDVTPYRQRMRIQVHGTPLSETIIEDRG